MFLRLLPCLLFFFRTSLYLVDQYHNRLFVDIVSYNLQKSMNFECYQTIIKTISFVKMKTLNLIHIHVQIYRIAIVQI